ncbi:MAG: hypothetical protein H0U61_01440 [Nocardioidaceae bacterium]|nr:hypothetical protein [Nocardioidaceae bacterium]
MSKVLLLAAGATGYVLGARAGRERYEQIVTLSQRTWSSPKVQQAKHDAQDLAREKAPIVGEKLGDAAKRAASSVQSKAGMSGSPDVSDNPNIVGPQGDLP